MKKILVLLVALVLALAVLGLPSGSANAARVKNLNCTTSVDSGTFRNVTVKAGESCTLGPDVVVLGNVHGKKGAVNIIVQTGVGRNIQVNGATGTVYVGPGPDRRGRLCRVDPPVGNNVHVHKSHNVLICEVTAKNNIMVVNNDGYVVVQDSVAGNSIKVNRNSKFVRDRRYLIPVPKPGVVRVVRNVADNHIQLFKNDPRRVIQRKNTPKPIIK